MHWITHIVFEGLPHTGVRKIHFYTQQEDPNEFFWGIDNNPRPKEEIQRMVDNSKIIPVQEKISLKETETLFIDPDGVLFLAHYMDSSKNRKEIGMYDSSISKVFQEPGESV
jgi:hypothetical protein